MNDAIKQAIDALEAACGNRCNAEYNPCQAREAIAALRAQPAIPEHIKSIKIPTRVMEQEFQNYYRRGYEACKKLTQPDHSELIAKLRLVAKYHRSDRQASDDAVILEAANALEGK